MTCIIGIVLFITKLLHLIYMQAIK